MDERIKFLRAEKSEQFAMVDDLQMELGKLYKIFVTYFNHFNLTLFLIDYGQLGTKNHYDRV